MGYRAPTSPEIPSSFERKKGLGNVNPTPLVRANLLVTRDPLSSLILRISLYYFRLT